MDAAQLAPEFKLPKGKAACLIVVSKTDYQPRTAELEKEFGSRVRFIKLDWSSDAGRDAAKEFSIQKSPACVVADAKGHVVLKMEGAIILPMIRSSLASAVGHRGQ